jgi:hypothetical protein
MAIQQPTLVIRKAYADLQMDRRTGILEEIRERTNMLKHTGPAMAMVTANERQSRPLTGVDGE